MMVSEDNSEDLYCYQILVPLFLKKSGNVTWSAQSETPRLIRINPHVLLVAFFL